MAWIHSQRLRGTADKVRAIGWVNAFISAGWAVIHSTEGSLGLLWVVAWGVAVMALSYGVAWIIDRRADRVVGR